MFKIIYKPKNESSFQTINRFRKENNIKKIGHTGTLDPLAQGLLLVAINDYTKLIPLIENKTKEYIVELKLGFSSKTYDEEGPIQFYSSLVPDENEVINVVNGFVGKQKQIPPIFSAKKINGKAAYKYARQEQEIHLKPIEIEIFSISNIQYQYPFIKFKVKVSNGTYIRSLVNDIGNKLQTKAYMTFLERTMVNGIECNDTTIDCEKLLGCKKIKIKNEQIKLIEENKMNFLDYNDGKYILCFENKIIGYIIIKDSKKEKIKLFGNELKLLDVQK